MTPNGAFQFRPLILTIASGMHGYRLAYVGGTVFDTVRDPSDPDDRAVIWYPTMEAARDAKRAAEEATRGIVCKIGE